MRFEKPEKLHVTLAFLGSVETTRIPAIAEAVRDAAAGTSPFRIAFDVVGGFPNLHRPRVLWLGCKQANPDFNTLARRIRSALSPLGFQFQNEPALHVTIARVKERVAVTALAIEPFAAVARECILFRSIPAGETTRYEVIAAFPLARS